jgi:hypothetical protein
MDFQKNLAWLFNTANSYGYPTFLGEVGIPSRITSGNLLNYRIAFEKLPTLPNFAGALLWGGQFYDGKGNLIFGKGIDANDDYENEPTSSQALLFKRYLPSFAHPEPNEANAKAGIS